MKDETIDWERLDRYVSGEGTPEERAALERWVDSDPELRALAEAMRVVGRPVGAAPGEWDARAGWQSLQNKMRLAGRPQLRVITTGSDATPALDSRRRRAQPRRAVWRPLAAAASIVVALGSGLLLWRSQATSPTEPPAAVAIEMREFSTGRMQRSMVYLPDGSRVVLAPETRIRVPTTYNSTHGPRDLYLEGQAFFTVEHDEERPFRVYAANGIAEDLGTEFTVTAYPETGGMEVLVATGAVALHRLEPGAEEVGTERAEMSVPLFTLMRGDFARLDSQGDATLTRGVDVDALTAWTAGRLVFDGTQMAEAIPALERWYDIEVRLADPALAKRRLTATFGPEPLPQVLELLALSLDLKVERDGNIVTLSPRSGARRPQ